MSDGVRRTPESRDWPNRVELANHYYKDAVDLLKKYQLAWYSKEVDFQGIKSRRTKAYIDLRTATETLLKAMVCLRASHSEAGNALTERVRKFNHDIHALAQVAFRKLDGAKATLAMLEGCQRAPISFRYDFEAMSARQQDEQGYYDTIGSDKWMTDLEKFVSLGVTRIGKVLSRRSKLVTGRVAVEEMIRRR